MAGREKTCPSHPNESYHYREQTVINQPPSRFTEEMAERNPS